MATVYLSVGSNLGDRMANLRKGQELLVAHPQINLIKASAFYQTSPVGGVVQDDFINQALAIETDLDPYDLLEYLHEIEAKLLRKRLVVWGPRTLDLDILYFDHLESEDPKLTIPHPEIMNRLFVLIPLKEIIDSNFFAYEQIQQAIERLEDSQDQRIERVDENERN
ncbi:2-amino-4-hydroxy-6-hydroxymethyldihydropteridine diphosphokinase [Facklamia sp. 7083-14-GEN3]|uniref:2-amino-4-hydroxy-6- hydroxymethyldihydropteridine diphosphokinase n=1 Tax=Facklamia sp. 7083-14-GEN3 TaxID=2973478 RepID=UPI00215CEFA3|nr:2-amino-4-hydroxy-6-hydroxymethyldihydropteridine diphosphokinase [Facklamia sp. 7083-14-GEN3]MCR8969028.1 2-amino-4-hydroxy-6-hydroxymethyldihydropteridine diphosphokinase [Facklamia sp. 7083-14-GEN3]